MKTIKIFLASSEELKQERLELADLVEHLNHTLAKLDLHIQLVKWEYLDSSMGIKHKQEEYNEELRSCELCMVLYWTKFGMYTKTELDTAYNELCAGRNPHKLYVYFKDSAEIAPDLQAFRDSFPSQYGHFFCHFENIDTLKADFLLQFMDYQSKAIKDSKLMEVKDAKVIVDGKAYVDLKNVPFACNNEEYNLLQKSIKKTQKLLAITEPDDPDYTDYVQELQNLKDKLAKMENGLWDTALLITQLSTTKCSERLQRAITLFNNGDAKGAQAILNEEEIEKDVNHNLQLIKLGEEGKKGLKINIDEYKLIVNILKTEMPDGWLQEQCKLCSRIIELTASLYGELSIETAQALMDATEPYYLTENYQGLLDNTLRALEIRQKIFGADHLDTAQAYNDAGLAYGKLGDFDKYLELASKGLEIREKLGASDALMAESYNTVGFAYSHFGGNERNLEYQLKSLELRKKAFGENNIETANAYSNVGVAYAALEQYDMYLEQSLRSLEIKRSVVGNKHPDTALSHNNVGDAYMCTEDYPNAIKHLQEALTINISTVGYYKEGTLQTFENLSLAYEHNNELEKSIDNQMEAIKIAEKLYGRVHPRTQISYQRAGEKLDDYGDCELALKYLYEAFDIQLNISGDPTFDLADLCHTISSLHYALGDFEHAKRMIENAINILSDVDDNHPVLEKWNEHLHKIEEKSK